HRAWPSCEACCQVPAGAEDESEQRDDGEQVDGPAVVTVGADFPAHCCFLPVGSITTNAILASAVPCTPEMHGTLGRGAAKSGSVDAAPASIAAGQIPACALWGRQRHVVDA